MMEQTKRQAVKWATLVPGVFLVSALMAESLPAQDKQNQQARRSTQQQSQNMDRSPFSEDLLVIKMAERSNLTQTIKVSVKDGVATISGKVPDEQAKRRALRIARNTAGILSVRDEISIDPSLKRVISDKERNVNEKELVKQVAQKIAASIEGAKAGEDWWFEGWRVEGEFNTWSLVVEVDEPGFVILQGEVPSLDIMRKAVEAAAAVPGVRALDTNLELDLYYAHGYPYRGFGYPYAWGYPYYPAYGFAPYAHYPHAPLMQTDRQARTGGQDAS
jgi:osmotically-inducible protein OsmY